MRRRKSREITKRKRSVAKKMLDELEEAIDKGVPVVHEVGFESVLGKPFEIKIVEGYQDDEQFEQEEHTVLTDSEETEGLNQEEADAEKISEEIFVLEENNAKDKLEESGIKQDEVDLSGQESSLGNAEFNL